MFEEKFEVIKKWAESQSSIDKIKSLLDANYKLVLSKDNSEYCFEVHVQKGKVHDQKSKILESNSQEFITTINSAIIGILEERWKNNDG